MEAENDDFRPIQPKEPGTLVTDQPDLPAALGKKILAKRVIPNGHRSAS